MKAFMNSNQLKVFARILRFLARTGNELYFEATQNGLVLRAINSSKTCFCSVTFLEHFFLSYQTTGDVYEDNNCRISVRPLLTILKNYKAYLQCQLRLDSGKERLLVDMTKPFDIHVQNRITILENETVEDITLPKKEFSTLICQPAVLSNILTNLASKSLREVAFNVFKDFVEIRNHINHPDKDVQTVRLKFKLDSTEFTSYEIANDSCLILSSVDLLSIVELAEHVKDEVKLIFTKNGKPLIASVLSGEGNVRIQLVMSTMREETLKTLRKPPLATSYKQIVNSYLETRKSLHGSEDLEVSIAELSDTEMQRAISPRVDSFGSHLASGSRLRNEVSVPQKRKSVELTPFEDLVASNAEIPESYEQLKKQKIDEIQSQEEQEVSKILTDLENYNYEDEEIEIGNPPRNTSSLKMVEGMASIKFNLKLKGTISNDTLSGETSESELPACSARFDATKARFATEDLVNTKNVRRSSRSSAGSPVVAKTNENQAKPKKTKSQVQKIIRTNRLAKEIFGGVLKTMNSTTGGETLVRCSDPESDESDGVA